MPVYEGTRWRILYGSNDEIQGFALRELQRMVQLFFPYVLRVEPACQEATKSPDNLIIIGTPGDNPLIHELSDKNLIRLPTSPQGFAIACFDSPWDKQKRVIVTAGRNAEGVLYAVQTLNARILSAKIMPENPTERTTSFNHIPDFSISEYPLIDNRGIWTWGYVIYDYRRFIDNMARLKMNMLTIWNDCPPVNASDVISYAHSRGVRVLMGFHWGWGIQLDPTNPEDLQRVKAEVLSNYQKNYRHLGADGIYFQTFTETTNTHICGKSIASLACEWVNSITAELYTIDPELYIQFGLHAMSILDNYIELKPLDPRITITWEDAGVLPFAYDPVISFDEAGFGKPAGLLTFDATLEYAKKLVSFRENREFAMVPKGFINLRWATEFEHHGPFILGERDPQFIASRLIERQPRWDAVNTLWLRNYPFAIRFYREILACNPTKTTVTALIEDGMFERAIQLSVAIFAETLWNPHRSEGDILELAMSPYYRPQPLQ